MLREYAVQAVHHLVSALAKDDPTLDAILGGGVEGLRNLLPPLPPLPPRKSTLLKSSAASDTRMEDDDTYTPGYSPAASMDNPPASQPDPSEGIRDNDLGPSDNILAPVKCRIHVDKP